MDRLEHLVVAEVRGKEQDFSDWSPSDWLAAKMLLKLGRELRGHLPEWGRKQKRSRVEYSSCNYDDEVEEHVTAPPAKERRRIMPPPLPAVDKPQQRSPKTTLPWSGNETASAFPNSPSSDSINSQRPGQARSPGDLPLEPKLKFKVERKLEVHNASNGKGPKKKTLAELKESFKGLSSEREEMEKEKEKLFNCLRSLRDMNKHLKGQLALKLREMGQDQLPTQSPTVSSDLAPVKLSTGHYVLDTSENLAENSASVAAMDWNSSAERISHCNQISRAGKSPRQDSLVPTEPSDFLVPDLNIPFDLSMQVENHEVEENNKAVVVAMANDKAVVVVEENNKAVVVVEENNKAVVVVEENNKAVVVVEENNKAVVVVEENNKAVVVVEENNKAVVVVEENNKAVAVAVANDKAVVAAEARKHRMECRRFKVKHSPSVIAQLRWH